jgi:hypothetical protein
MAALSAVLFRERLTDRQMHGEKKALQRFGLTLSANFRVEAEAGLFRDRQAVGLRCAPMAPSEFARLHASRLGGFGFSFKVGEPAVETTRRALLQALRRSFVSPQAGEINDYELQNGGWDEAASISGETAGKITLTIRAEGRHEDPS